MIYGDDPDQLQALSNLGPDALGAISPQLADFLYGPDTGDVAGDFEKGLGQFQAPPPPPFAPDPGEYVSWNVDPSLKNCEPCLNNADDDPRPYGTPFSSGDIAPPIHDRCGCFLSSSVRGSCPIHGYSRDRIFELSSIF
jgi:hypothetical protein